MGGGVSDLSVCIQQVREVGDVVFDLFVCIKQDRELGMSDLSVRIQEVREVGDGVSYLSEQYVPSRSGNRCMVCL